MRNTLNVYDVAITCRDVMLLTRVPLISDQLGLKQSERVLIFNASHEKSLRTYADRVAPDQLAQHRILLGSLIVNSHNKTYTKFKANYCLIMFSFLSLRHQICL